jgi:hypothetical protein
MTKRQSFSFKEGNYKIIYLVLLKKGNLLALRAILKLNLVIQRSRHECKITRRDTSRHVYGNDKKKHENKS